MYGIVHGDIGGIENNGINGVKHLYGIIDHQRRPYDGEGMVKYTAKIINKLKCINAIRKVVQCFVPGALYLPIRRIPVVAVRAVYPVGCDEYFNRSVTAIITAGVIIIIVFGDADRVKSDRRRFLDI